MVDSSVLSANEEQSKFLLEEMEKTISQKVAVCAAHMLLKDGATVLDAGCADGQATAYFALVNPNVHVIGIDYDEDFIQAAKEKFGHIPNLEFIKDDLRSFDLGDRKLDAIVNLSILHEPFSYTGYRKKTVEEIIQSEIKNLKPGGVIINRDFVLPEIPEKMVYLALSDSGEEGNTPEEMSFPNLLKLYAKEAMAFDNNDPEGHIKGFFLEEHTDRFNNQLYDIPDAWRIFYLPHEFAWEFIWRKEYKERFYPESNEKYGFWTSLNHIEEPEKMGSRVTYAAHFENPWIFEHWYKPHAMIFDKDMQKLPLPPSNFISVLNKIEKEESVSLKEHCISDQKPSFLHIETFVNRMNVQKVYDMVKRPGGDVIDVIPYSVGDGNNNGIDNNELIIYAKADYPRPILNIHPRMMTPNLDRKHWSGHVIEPLAAAGTQLLWQESVNHVLRERSGLDVCVDVLTLDSSNLIYYTAPAELNERVKSVFVEVKGSRAYQKKISGGYSGFTDDGEIRSYTAQSILNASQVGMLPEARLEMNVYALMREKNKLPEPWIAGVIDVGEVAGINKQSLDELRSIAQSKAVFVKTGQSSGWLDIVRSEFQERVIDNDRVRVKAKKELEFIVPNKSQTNAISTNSVTVLCIIKENKSGEILVGLQKISDSLSQFPAIQERENYSGHITLLGYRLPSSVVHVQHLPQWIANELGVSSKHVKKLGEGYSPSLGVMPNRVFPYVVTELSDKLEEQCCFVSLKAAFNEFEQFQDAHLMISLARIVHALSLWEEYSK